MIVLVEMRLNESARLGIGIRSSFDNQWCCSLYRQQLQVAIMTGITEWSSNFRKYSYELKHAITLNHF